MAQYDGSIRINTEIQTKQAKIQLATLENRIVKTADKVGSLRSKMDTLKDVQIPTQAYKDIESDIAKAERELQKLIEKQAQMQNEGKDSGVAWDRINQRMQASKDYIEYAKEEMQQLVETGKAFTLGRDTEQYANLTQQLQYAENDLSVLNQRHDVLIEKQNKLSNGYKRLGSVAKESFERINKSAGIGFKNIIKYGLGIRSLCALFSKLGAAIKKGFSNLYNDKNITGFKNAVDSLKASALTLKNSFAAAFRPLVEVAIPYIQLLINYMIRLMNVVGQFMAAITGQKKYTKAIKQTTAAIEDQNKAQKKQLSNLDNLNNLTSDTGAGADGGAGAMFEEAPVDNRILDFLQKIKDLLQPAINYAQKLKDIFTQGFFDGLGDWEYRWTSIKGSIKSIKDSLKDIFTDPAVLASADKWAQSVAYLLGSFAGFMASIGLTMATNFLGGISKYLSQNKERIKGYLISMFDISSDINYIFAELFNSIAYVFEAFASESGQQLTANIIGIFVNAFMGITELALKLFRDIANIVMQPFVDNKEALRTALEGFLGVLSSVTGTIKQGIDETFDKLNEVYDEHFKPLFDSIAQGFSDLTGQFLDFWNGQIQPILDQWATDFDTLWTGHIQPLLDNVAEFLGKIADLLKVVWENYLQPLIAWIISNVLPKVLPVLQAIWDTLKNLAGYIADVISSVITILGGMIDFITGVLSGDWEKTFQGLQDVVAGFGNFINTTIEGTLQFISDIFKTFFEAIRAANDSFLQSIKSIVESAINYVKQNIFRKLNEIKSAFSGFKSNVSQTWINMWNGLKEKVKSILNDIKNTIKSAFDWITQKINSIGSAFSSFGSKASGVFSGFGSSGSLTRMSAPTSYAANPAFAALSSVEIPKLATGAVIPANREFLAVLGDQKHGTNVEAPLNTIKQAQKESLLEVLSELGLTGGNNNNDGNNVYEFSVDGMIFFRIMEKYAQEYKKKNGGKFAFT